VSGREQGKK